MWEKMGNRISLQKWEDETMKYKIYENGTVKECLQKLLDDGYMPLTLKQITTAKNNGKIKDVWYNSSTFYFWETGDIRDATKEELQGILNNTIKGRVLFVGLGDYSGRVGDDSLSDSGRFVGVKRK